MNRPRFLALVVYAGVALALAGCGDHTDPAPLSACTGPVTLSVSPGVTPRISWTPACRLFLVIVEDPSGGGGLDQWAVDSDSTDAIEPPVTYGVIPPGATKQLLEPVPLQAGQQYRVAVWRFIGPGHEDGELIDTLNFIP